MHAVISGDISSVLISLSAWCNFKMSVTVHFENSATDVLNVLFSRTTCLSWHQKGQTITNICINAVRDDVVAVASAGPYENHLLLTSDNHASISSLNFLQARDALTDAKPLMSKY